MSREPDVYICEKILKKRISKGVPQYLIKWKDYSMKASTWEPVEHILDPELLTSFEDELRRKKSNKKKIRRPSRTLVITPEAQVSPQENRNRTPLNEALSPTPSSNTVKTRSPTPEPQPEKSPQEEVNHSPQIKVPTPIPTDQSLQIRNPTPIPEPRAENGSFVLALQTALKTPSPPTRTLEVQTSPRPRLSKVNSVHDRPFTVITDVTVNSRTITISESLCRAL